MNLVLLGTGGGPWPHPVRFGPASLLVSDGATLLVDAGRGVVPQLARAGVELGAVDPVLVTHLHLDHICDLADLIHTSWLVGRRPALHVVGPPGISGVVDAIVHGVFRHDVASELAEAAWYSGQPIAAPSVRVSETLEGAVEAGAPWTVHAAQVEHGGGLYGPAEWHALGYRVAAEGRVVTFSGDAGYSAGLVELAAGSDVLVVNCWSADSELESEKDRLMAEHMIAAAGQAGRLARDAGVGTLVLTHFGPEARLDEIEPDVRRHFGGPVILGQDLLEIAV